MEWWLGAWIVINVLAILFPVIAMGSFGVIEVLPGIRIVLLLLLALLFLPALLINGLLIGLRNAIRPDRDDEE